MNIGQDDKICLSRIEAGSEVLMRCGGCGCACTSEVEDAAAMLSLWILISHATMIVNQIAHLCAAVHY